MDKKEEVKRIVEEKKEGIFKKSVKGEILKQRSDQEALEIAKQALEEVKPFMEAVADDAGVSFAVSGDPNSYFNPKEGKINLGWASFKDPTSTPLSGAAVLFHELGHLRHLLTDSDTILEATEKNSPVIFPLYNVVDDMEIEEYLRKYDKIRKEREKEYRYVASTRDFQKEPKSSQFLLGLLEYAMLNEMPRIDPEVIKAIKSLESYNGVNVIDFIKNTEDPALRHNVTKRIVQPIFERFIEEDRKSGLSDQSLTQAMQQLSKELGGISDKEGKLLESKEEGSSKSSEGEEGERKGKLPFNMSKEDIEKLKENFEKHQQTKDNLSKLGGWMQKEYEVKPSEVADYRSDYDSIKHYVKSVADELEKIVEEHISLSYGFTHPKRRGVFIEPGLMHEAYISLKTGREASIFKDVKKIRKVHRVYPTEVNFYLLCDMSESMEGEKEELQRKSAVLLMEGIAEYMRRLEEKRRQLGISDAGFEAKVEIYRFGSQSIKLKDRNEEFLPKVRINVHKYLFNANEGATREDLSLSEISKKIDSFSEEEKKLIKEGEKKHIILLLTDGESGNPEGTKKIVNKLRNSGIEVWGVGIGEEAEESIKNLLGEEFAKPIESPKELPDYISAFVKSRIKLKRVE